jgi:hypothetical protein
MKQGYAFCLIHAGFLLGFCSTLKMAATSSSKTSVEFHWTT